LPQFAVRIGFHAVWLSKIITGRLAASYAGQCGISGLSGFPDFANAMKAEPIRRAIYREGEELPGKGEGL
jgi:hypothetical protein